MFGHFWNFLAVREGSAPSLKAIKWMVKLSAKLAKQNQTDDIHSRNTNCTFTRRNAGDVNESWNELYIVLYIHLLVSRATTDKQISYSVNGNTANAGS